MRLTTNNTHFPWPSSLPEFKEIMLKNFSFFSELGRFCLSLLASELGVLPSQFLNLLDSDPLSLDTFSNSLLTIYQYYSNVNESVAIHKDIGLLTFVPCAQVPGLQVLDYEYLKWIEIEKIANPKTDIIVFNSECLERLTAQYYSACIHRVMSELNIEQRRSSMVFKVRARPDAILDTQSLQSSLLSIPYEYQQPIKVEDYICLQLKSRKSVNFSTPSLFSTYGLFKKKKNFF